jgi:hypothetical protein
MHPQHQAGRSYAEPPPAIGTVVEEVMSYLYRTCTAADGITVSVIERCTCTGGGPVAAVVDFDGSISDGGGDVGVDDE